MALSRRDGRRLRSPLSELKQTPEDLIVARLLVTQSERAARIRLNHARRSWCRRAPSPGRSGL